MKKFTEEIKMLLSTALIGTAGIGLLTSCGDERLAGDVQRVDDMTGNSSSLTNVIGATQNPDETTEEQFVMGDVAAPDECIISEEEETTESITSTEMTLTEETEMTE